MRPYASVMRVLPRTAVVLAVLAIGWPAAANAKKYLPPGKAGASEYAEVVPTAGGGVKPPTNDSTAGGAALSKLGAGRAGAHKLQKLGMDGQQAAGFARATAPRLAPVSSGGGPSASASIPRTGGSAVSGLLSLLGGSDGGGIGLLLPLLLACGLGAAVATVVGRQLRRGQASP
jgi:hypothetical protein